MLRHRVRNDVEDGLSLRVANRLPDRTVLAALMLSDHCDRQARRRRGTTNKRSNNNNNNNNLFSIA